MKKDYLTPNLTIWKTSGSDILATSGFNPENFEDNEREDMFLS